MEAISLPPCLCGNSTLLHLFTWAEPFYPRCRRRQSRVRRRPLSAFGILSLPDRSWIHSRAGVRPVETSHDIPSRDDPCAKRSFHSMSFCWHSKTTLRSRKHNSACASVPAAAESGSSKRSRCTCHAPVSCWCRSRYAHTYSGSAGACELLCSWRLLCPKIKTNIR